MPGLRDRRFTIYDAMESAGVFEANPANTYARDAVSGDALYTGPVEFPKMFYHPLGAMRVMVPAEEVETKAGRIVQCNEQRELIYEIARTAADEKRLRADGWHDHPADALGAGGHANVPVKTSVDRIKQLEAEIARMQAERDAGAASQLAAQAANAEQAAALNSLAPKPADSPSKTGRA